MLREKCSPHQENLAAYSLGILDAEEIIASEAHLETCEECQAELADYQTIAEALLHSIPPQTPPASLRHKLLTRLPSPQKRTSRLFPRFLDRVSFGQFATAALLLTLLVLNLFSAVQIRALQQQQNALTERLSTERAAVALLAYPDTQVLFINSDIQNLTGSALVDKDNPTAVLFLWNLPELASGQVYQIWLVDGNGQRLSAGLFTPAEDEYTAAFIESTVPLGQYIAIGVTVEPWGGSEQPTGSRVLSVDL